MTLNDEQRRQLASLLELTEDQEMDCDTFSELLPAMVDGRIEDELLLALIEHHKAICPECEEARALLAKAVGA